MNRKSRIITIVTPSYNQGKFIEEAIESIWNQKGDFYIEHFIADGGSSDNTIDIIKKFEKELLCGEYQIKCKGIKLIWWSRRDSGQASVLNLCFKKAKGDILSWLNSDDFYENDECLQKVINTFKISKCDVMFSNAYYTTENGRKKILHQYAANIEKGFLNNQNKKLLFQFDYIPQPSTFFSAKLNKELEIDGSWYYGMDWDLWARAIKKDFSFFKEDYFIGCMRMQKNAKTQQVGVRFYQEKLKFFREYHVWGFNRVYCYFMILRDKLQHIPILLSFFDSFVVTLGKIKKLFKKIPPVG